MSFYDMKLMEEAYDALAIYNYTRLPAHLFTKAESDQFAESVERIVKKKKEKDPTLADEMKPTYIECVWEKAAKAGPESYKKVLSRGQSGWGGEELAKNMLQVYKSLPKGKEKQDFQRNLAISEAVLLDAMDDFSVMLEGVAGNPSTIQKHAAERVRKRKEDPEIQAKIEFANKEKRDKMKARIAKGILTGAAVAGGAYALYKINENGKMKSRQRETAELLTSMGINNSVDNMIEIFKTSEMSPPKNPADYEKLAAVFRPGIKEGGKLYERYLRDIERAARDETVPVNTRKKRIRKLWQQYEKEAKELRKKYHKQLADVKKSLS